MAKVKDLTGRSFVRLRVIELHPARNSSGAAQWKCQCVCGTIVVVASNSLLKGLTKSCGCLRRHRKKGTERPGRPRIDIKGKRFGRLVPLSQLEESNKHGQVLWNCRCDCGTVTVKVGENLRKGLTKSCGCLHKRHGMSGTKEYSSWTQAKIRVTSPNNPRWKDYGGRGIGMCKEWLDSFENFFADMGPRPSSEHTLDRIDNNGDYCPENCRWATREEQMNNKRNNVNVEGIPMALYCKNNGLVYESFRHYYVKKGLPATEAMQHSRRIENGNS